MLHSLVTGANRGLGLAFVRHLLEREEQVLACCRDPDAATELQALAGDHGGRLRIEQLDLTDVGVIDSLAGRLETELPRLDRIIHNAGILVSGERFGTVRAADLERSFAVNASAPLLLT